MKANECLIAWTPETSRIRDALAEAAEHDREAHELRKLAGRLLARARAEAPAGVSYLPPGLDERTADMLLRLAAGGQMQEGSRDG